MKKEFIHLTATPRLLELLSSINHEISFRLIECIKYRNMSPISFLDFGDTNDTITFIQSNKLKELCNKYGEEYKKYAWTTKRSSIKIGKSIKLIFSDLFPVNQPKDQIAPKPPVDIESFVNMFKAERDKNKNYERFEIVKGLDIRYWYNQENYSRFIQEDTSLAKSCSRYKEAGKYLEMYVSNPDIVNMLILKDDVNRLRGRAIVWNLTYPENRIYMDRVYSINDCDVESFKNYAKEQGWLYKSKQTYGFHHNIVDSRNNEEYVWENFIMKAQIKPKEYKYYPYLDTLCVYNRETGLLCNDGRLLIGPPHIRLAHPEGGFSDEAEYRELVFSRVYNREIVREDATFVSLDQDWVYSYEVIYVHNTGGKTSYINSPLIVESNILGNKKFFLKEECVYSDYLGTYIYKDSVKEAYLDKNMKEKILIHKRLVHKFFDVTNDGIIIKKKVENGKDLLKEYLDNKNSVKTISNDSLFRISNANVIMGQPVDRPHPTDRPRTDQEPAEHLNRPRRTIRDTSNRFWDAISRPSMTVVSRSSDNPPDDIVVPPSIEEPSSHGSNFENRLRSTQDMVERIYDTYIYNNNNFDYVRWSDYFLRPSSDNNTSGTNIDNSETTTLE